MPTNTRKPAIAKSRGGKTTIEVVAHGDGKNRYYRLVSDNRSNGVYTERNTHGDFLDVADARARANELWATLP